MSMPSVPRALRAVLVVVLLFGVVACASAAAPSAPPGSASPPAASPDGSGAGSDPGGSVGGPGNGGGGDPGVVDPGQPQLVVPKPGQLDVHPVAIEELEVRVDGRHAVLNARWTSGVDPCYVLDSVAWKRDGHTITVSVREGHGPEDVICIEIAVLKATVIDLGELEPGDYTVLADEGPAPAITFTIP